MLIVLLLILRKFLVVAGNKTDKTIRWPSYNYKGGKPDSVYVYSGVCGTYGYL